MVLLQALIFGRVVLDKIRLFAPRIRHIETLQLRPVRTSRLLSPEERSRYLSQKREKVTLSSGAKSRRRQDPNTEEEWIPIYRFNFIGIAALLSRAKLYQTVFVSIILVPGLCVSYAQGIVGLESLRNGICVGLFSLLMLYVITNFSQRLVGVMAIDPNGELVRIGYLNFWGKRRNAIVPVDSILPLTDTNTDDSRKLYAKLRMENFKDVLYLPIKKGEVLEKQIFEEIFGDYEPLRKEGSTVEMKKDTAQKKKDI